ncbi:phytanoyl-CoA dioxygenase family protein [Thalassococcus sp. BH17M4-6]|uniref:phytanoyl-CoA dioxygenase family protein n=1 Tax=Thalassococcus sp. BH17M4-6 TaxID=3413148 RepID=UPI003BCE08B3
MKDQLTGYSGYFDADAGDLDAFKALTSRRLDPAEVPQAARVEKNIPLYVMTTLAPALADPDQRRALLAEWNHVLSASAGVIVLKAAYPDTAPIDRASQVFRAIIAEERSQTAGKGDHFAAAGANDRIWNSLQKQCLRDPEGFALYFGNPAIAAASEAWLGPNYQMTAQVNQVRPGGKAQNAHRDYHLGFQTAEGAARYPALAHLVTATLTLQGAVAHCDMSVESGPTKLLPFSQLYGAGYVAMHDSAHADWFEEACVQLPLAKGDALFFNPALFHAAGANRTGDVERMVNLLQVSSAFGRSLEAVDRAAMTRAIFPALKALRGAGRLTPAEVDAAVAATAEGYPFPTNLDTDPPIGGLAPASQADILRRALAEDWTPDALDAELTALATRQRP